MARIRSIKPEFPQSESMGNISRDARLLFIELWTIADDSGRLRGASRMLASLLFPYDEDAPRLMDTWLTELEREGCIVRYRHGNGTYIEVCNWLSHQKIDKPTKSKIPSFEESSRTFANPLEASSEDLRTEGSKDLRTEERIARTNGHSVPAIQDNLFAPLRNAFQSKNPLWPKADQEVQALHWLVDAFKVAAPESPEQAALRSLEKFWELTQTGRDFWKRQVFVPSRMKALWGDLMKEIELDTGLSADLADTGWEEFEAAQR